MKFGPVAAAYASGAILAHSVKAASGTIRKGTVLGDAQIQALAAAGVAEVVVARLDPGDVHEDDAAAAIAGAIAGEHVRLEPAFTGRCNLYAEAGGLVRIDRDAVERLNRIDPAITLATLAEFALVRPGQMVATVKIIPFAVARGMLDSVLRRAIVSVAPFGPLKVGLVATTLPSLKPSVMDKTRRLLNERLAPAGASVTRETRVPHDAGAVAEALVAQVGEGAELLVAFGASAVVDADDVIPAAIVGAGGRIVRLGMPVDPGNLLVLGELAGRPVIGAPGCARSPKENGFDWILNRLLAGIKVTSDDIAGLGVGGLLTEIATRPQPREGRAPRIGAIVLAAGSSRRMGGDNKLLATVGGKPLVRLAAEAALGSRATPVIVVTGPEAERVKAALTGLDVRFADNPDHASGMSTSVRAGLAALPVSAEGAIVLLGDMPEISPATVDALIAQFAPGRIVVATSGSRRGNPVLWSRQHFAALAAVEGDTGGRGIIEANPDAVLAIDVGPASARDIDTPADLVALAAPDG